MSDREFLTDEADDAIAGDYPLDAFGVDAYEGTWPGWAPSSLLDADWHARQVAKQDRRLAEIDDVYETALARLDAWRERTSERAIKSRAAHIAALEHYHAALLRDDPKAKTVELPGGGRLRSQAGRLQVAVVDEVEFLTWAREHAPETIKVTEKPDKTVIAKAFGAKAAQEKDPGSFPAVTPDGEIVPGVGIVRAERAFFVDTVDKLEGDRTSEA